MKECKYRRYTHRPDYLQLHCYLKRNNCMEEECEKCSYITPEGNEIDFYHGTPEPARRAFPLESLSTWIVDHPSHILVKQVVNLPKNQKKELRRQVWPPCALRRLLRFESTPCGCRKPIMQCDNSTHEKFQKEIERRDCWICEIRIE